MKLCKIVHITVFVLYSISLIPLTFLQNAWSTTYRERRRWNEI